MQPDQLEFWVDMNLPSCLADWIIAEFKIPAKTFVQLGFQTTADIEVFKQAASQRNVIVITTKDYDFVNLKSPHDRPKILYLNIGNVTNKVLREIFDQYFPEAFKILKDPSKVLVEIKNEL
jgi:predicted nuclease of predicted toxin-antitoxin system